MSKSQQHKSKGRLLMALSILLGAIAIILAVLLIDMDQSSSPNPSGKQETSYDNQGFPEVDWEYWKSINSDIIGWVTVPGTNIDYPIVQASSADPDYYLHHDIYKNYNVYGVPYLDASCSTYGLDSANAVVFGHHMNNDTMFSAFANYSDEAYAKEHSRILLQTPDWKRVEHVNLVEVIDGTKPSKRTDFIGKADYDNWYKEQIANACVTLNNETTYGVTTFCTCSYNIFDNERTLVLSAPSNYTSPELQPMLDEAEKNLAQRKNYTWSTSW